MKNKIILSWLCYILLILLIFSCKINKIPPEIKYEQNYSVISPNQDGIQDTLIIQASINTQNFIIYWDFQIFDESKNVIFNNNSGNSLEKLKKKLFHKKQNVFIPDEFVWDAKDNEGNIVKDGKYFIKFIIMDNNKNIFDTETIGLGTVFVDTVPPNADVQIDDNIISPNNDGNKDQITMSLGIIENELEKKYDEIRGDNWILEIENNAGLIINKMVYNDKNSYKTNIVWNGKDLQNKIVPDGTYTFKIYSIDKGGNTWEKIITDINVNTEDNPVEMKIADRAFSPNGDKIKDSININLIIKDNKNIDKWTLSILNSLKGPVKIFSGNYNIAKEIAWDGLNDQNVISPEGEYNCKLIIVNNNGNISETYSESFLLDITPPSSSQSANYNVFSPDKNGIKDNVAITQYLSDEKTPWNAKITDQNNKVVLIYLWTKIIQNNLKWFGTDQKNQKLPDGVYFYQTFCTDLAGNYYESPKLRIEIFTKKENLKVATQTKSFSPNKDGNSDNIAININIAPLNENPVVDWEIIILDKEKLNVFNQTFKGSVPEKYFWNGLNNDNKIITEGEYTAFLSLNTLYGVTTTNESPIFTVDLSPPDIIIEKDKYIFSPDNDGIDDTIKISFIKAYDKTGIKKWRLDIISPITNTPFYSYSGNGIPKKDIIWDGKGKNGQLVGSAEDYNLIVTSEDILGNKGTKKFNPIWTDILITKLNDGRLKIRISNIIFIPDRAVMTGDKKNGEVLNMLGKALKKYPDYKIQIEGYANKYKKNVSESTGYKLSVDRTQIVSTQLQKRGIAKARLKIIGKGFENPIIPLKEKMTEDEKKEMWVNRRVEFYLSK